MTTDTINLTTSDVWVCPAGVNKADITLHGGGGGGASNKPGTTQLRGGGGLQGSTTTLNLHTVIPGNSYYIGVGGGGLGATLADTAGAAGGATTFYDPIGGDHSAAGGAGGGRSIPWGDSGDGTGTGYGAGGAANTNGVNATGNLGAGGGGAGNWISEGGILATGGNGSGGYATFTYTPASAAFSGTPLTGDKPLTVTFTGPASQTAYAWDFGDGETASTQSPAHVYHFAGKKTVILATTNDYGFAVETKVDYITGLFKARMHAMAQMSDSLRRT